jgi:hypothetical protein
MAGRLAALILCLTLSTALAQPSRFPDIATNHALLAAYCLGQTKQERMNIPAGAVEPNVEAQFRADINARIWRFYTYLYARGFFTGGRGLQSVIGIRTAFDRGTADENACPFPHLATTAPCQAVDRCLRFIPPL